MATYRAPDDTPGEGRLLLVWGPVIAWLGMWGALLGWYVDDAGITWAYAREIAAGNGLVPHAGAPPSEGFSNPAWTLLLALAARLGISLPVATDLLQALCGIGTLLALHGLVRRTGGERAEATGAALIAAIASPFVVWTAGGLETALLSLCLTGILFAAAARWPAWVLGVLGAGVALSRPEGPLLAAAALAGGALLDRPDRRWRRLALAGLLALVAWLGWLALRQALLGQWFPSAWWVKVDASLPSRLVRGALYLGTFGAQMALPMLAVGWVTGWRVRRLGRLVRATTLVVVVQALVVLYVGGDWMRHGRLMAPLVPLIAAASAPGLLTLFFRPMDVGRTLPGRAMRTVAVLFVAAFAGIQLLFWQDALRRPPLPLSLVEEVGDLFARVGPALCGEPTPSMAAPDVGGLLHAHPEATVIDLGGLADPHPERARDPSYWRQRLASVRPQLVLVHGPWVPRTGLDDGVLYEAGYRLLCRRSGTPGPAEQRFPPSVYRRVDCTQPLSEPLRHALDAWCARPR